MPHTKVQNRNIGEKNSKEIIVKTLNDTPILKAEKL